jgi:hypothetical protein
MQLSFDRIWFGSAERGELVAADLVTAFTGMKCAYGSERSLRFALCLPALSVARQGKAAKFMACGPSYQKGLA